jgi:eukaryotic-like serine/threonine-protein kinase
MQRMISVGLEKRALLAAALRCGGVRAESAGSRRRRRSPAPTYFVRPPLFAASPYAGPLPSRLMGEASFGKYRLIAELGHGGMADVFLAVQAGPAGSGFRKLTVIKRLRQNLAEEPEFIAMLVDEARIAARLNHPNVVQTNEVGQVAAHYFIAMEYLDGQPLHRIQHRSMQRMKEGKPSPVSKEGQYIVVMDALAGLHHAHELNDFDGTPLQIVHRDVTPHNIFVTYAGQVKVVDFGIAKAAGRASETRQGVVKGKVRYMAPEQAIGHTLDRRSDLFAMGVILWEVATGRRMWKDKDDLQIVHDLVGGKIPHSPRAVEPSVPEGLDRICQKALATKADDRYATAEDFRLDLESFLAETGQLVEARRRLAPSISELFDDKRNEIRSVIEKQIAALEEKVSGEFEAVPIPPDSISGPSLMTPASARSAQSIVTEAGGVTTSSDPNLRATGSEKRGSAASRWAVRGLAATAIAAVAVSGVVFVRRTPEAVPAATAMKPATDNGMMKLKLDVKPATARVFIDDGAPKAVPVELVVPKDGKEHKVRLEADGFTARTETIRFASDLAASYELHPVEKTANVGAGDKRKPPPPAPTVVTIVKTVQVPTTAKPPETAAAPPTAAPATPPTVPTIDRNSNGAPRKEPDKGDPWATK